MVGMQSMKEEKKKEEKKSQYIGGFVILFTSEKFSTWTLNKREKKKVCEKIFQ